MLDIETYLQGADSVDTAIKQFTQGMAGGWKIANQLLGIAGGHSNRTTTVYYNNNGEDDESNSVEIATDLEIDRLASQMDIIASEAEVKAGLIMMISGGLLLGHWKKFQFSDNFKPKAYIDVWKAQYFYEKGCYGQLSPNVIEASTARFNEFHREMNKALQEVYGDLDLKIQQRFDDFFTILATRAKLESEDYDTFNQHRLELLAVDTRRPLIMKLHKVIQTSDDPKELWQIYLNTRAEINFMSKPTKASLFPIFNSTKSHQRTNEPKFINHLKTAFGDDFEKIVTKLNLEVA